MDDIKRKLALIDKQLTGGFFNSYQRIITTSPLVFAAVGLILGILIQSTFFESRVTSDGSRFIWLVLLIISAISAVLLFVIKRWEKIVSFSLVLLSACVFICFTCLGAIRLNSFHTPRPNDIRNLVSGERRLATIRGLIVTDPYINKNKDWKFARFTFTDPDTSFYLRLSELKTIDGWADVTGTVRVQVAEPVLDLKAGDYIQAYCWLDRFEHATNPGQFDIKKYLARKNVFIAASIKSRDGIELLKGSPAGLFTKIKSSFKNTATQALLGGPYPQDQGESLLQALLLGYRRDIDSVTYRAFRKTGLLHFISLSGMHLGILIGTVWWLCKTIGLMKRSRAIVCIIAIAVFLLIVPPRAPTLRAAIIGWVFCLSFLFRRKSDSVNTLSLAAIILLLIKPTDLFSAGWQLSFASVLGIILFTDRIHFFLYEKITAHRWLKVGAHVKLLFRTIARAGSYILQLFSVGLAAWLAGVGILLYHFYTINPLTSIWTVIVFPFVAAILTLGYLKMVLSFLLPTAASVLALVVTQLADFLVWIIKLLAHLDFSQILIGRVPIAVVIFYYCTIAFAFFVYFRRPLLRKAICSVMLLTVFIFLGGTKWQRTYRDNLVLTCLDVGHGQAILVQLPGRANLLFDAGSLYRSDIGRRIVAPFLDYFGIEKIDAVIVSHNDIDHINGIPEIAEHCEVGAVFANDCFLRKTDSWGTAKFLNDCLLEQGHKIQIIDKTLNLNTSAGIKILWPTEQICQNEQLSDNNKSMVILMEYAGRKLLLPADIMKFSQRELLKLYPDLKADIVVIPHHGSAKSAEPGFLENLDAEILICSCGRSNYQNNRIIKPKGNAAWLCTPEHGAAIVRIDKNGIIK